ncbi:MAG: hypothetical protein IJB70_03250 [Clostridia bacterium]|nr:hypothetical protein [Clostridia bacterium]
MKNPNKNKVLKSALSLVLSLAIVLSVSVMMLASPVYAASSDFETRWKASSNATVNGYMETVNFDDQANKNLVNPQNVSTAYDSTVKQGDSGYSLKTTSTGGANVQFKGTAAFNAGPNNADHYMISYDFYMSKIPTADKLSNTVTYVDINKENGKSFGGLQVAKDTGAIMVEGVETGYSINAQEWHNFSFVISKKTGMYQYFFDGHLVAKRSLGYAGHIYDIGLYFPMEEGLSVYIDNAKIAALEPNDAISDYDKKWMDSSDAALQSYFETVNFDDQSNHNVVKTANVTTSYDAEVKQGNAGYSLKTHYAASDKTANVTFGGTNTFTGGPTRADVYMLSFDFYLSELPKAGKVRSTLNFYKHQGSSEGPGSYGTLQGEYATAGLQIANDGSGKVLKNSTETGYTLKAGEWHTYTVVVDKKNAAWYEYYDGNQIHYDYFSGQQTNGDYAHLRSISFDYSPNDDNFYLYIDNAQIKALEKAPVYELGISSFTCNKTTGKATVNVTNDGDDNEAVVIFANYRNDALVTVHTEPVSFTYGDLGTEKEFTFTDITADDDVKVFLWYSMDDLLPVCSGITK